MKKGLLRNCCRIAAGAVLAAAAGSASAAWPDKVIRIVVPFAAGGSTDLIARKIAEGLGQRLSANVIVENRPGAGGTVGTEYVARQPADGYTILMGSVSTHGSAPCVYSKLPYDAVKDFTPLAVVATIPNVMSVNQSVPAGNLKEFVALLKQAPEKYSFASNGQGTSNHLAAELFKTTAGVSIVHVPYRGSGPALIDLVGDGPPRLRLNLPSRQLGRVQAGTAFQLNVVETGKQYQARVTAVNARVDAVAQSIELEGRAEDPGRELLPGMSGIADFGFPR